MNCPNCGAGNDADARFCAECGAPLENQDLEVTIAGQSFRDEEDSDKTILTSPDEIDAEAKTVSVDQAGLAAAIAADDGVTVTEPEPTPPPPPDFSAGPDSGDSDGDAGSGSSGGFFATGSDGNGGRKRMMIIIGVVIILLLCCCCCALIGGIASSEDVQRALEDILDEISLLSIYYLPFV